MNPMLQRHCAKFIYIVPEGLKELMSDISREVLRSQPEHIYTFIADYLDALLITRENARIAIRLVDSIIEIAEDTVDTLLELGISRLEADIIVEIIQKHFRQSAEIKRKYFGEQEEGTEEEIITQGILNELDISLENLEKVTIVIQRAYRRFKEKQRREKEMLWGMVDWRVAARSAIALYKKTGVTIYEANRAATLIKAAYKGYYTRRVMRRLLQQAVEDEFIFEAVSVDDEKEESETSRFGTTHTTNLSTFEESAEEPSESTEAIIEMASPYTEERAQPEEDGFTFPIDQFNFIEYEGDYYEDVNLQTEEYLGEENIFEEFQGEVQAYAENIIQAEIAQPNVENVDEGEEVQPNDENVNEGEVVETFDENIPQIQNEETLGE